MTTTPEDIREIDLMAYADGLLEADAARKAAVEAYLEANSAEALRVRGIIEDNQAIRELYAGELSRPVPKRLVRAVHEPARSRRFAPMAVAAGLAVAFVAASGGWLAGQRSDDRATVSQELLREMARHYEENGTQTAMTTPVSRAANGTLMSSPLESVTIEIPLPDLSAHGFDLAGQKRIEVEGQEMVRLVYRSPDATMNLFMRLRGDADRARLLHLEAGDLAVHHWSSGPIAYVLTVPAKNGEASRLAEMVRDTIGQGHFVDLPPATMAGGEESIAGDGTLGVGQPAPRTAPPALQRNFN